MFTKTYFVINVIRSCRKQTHHSIKYINTTLSYLQKSKWYTREVERASFLSSYN